MLSYLPPGHKGCNDCGETKPLEQFGKDSGSADKHQPYCLDCHRARGKAWRENSPEKRRECNARWSARNKERRIAQQRQRRAANREAERLSSRKHSSIRRARRRAAFVEPVDIAVLLERDGWVCTYCGSAVDVTARFGTSAATIEHRIPLSRGGKHSYENCAVACASCNFEKGSKTESEYRTLKGL